MSAPSFNERRVGWRCTGLVAACVLWLGPVLAAEAGHPVPFRVQLLTVDGNEGCAVADFDGDGKPDVVAGRNWYRNGEWVPRPLRNIDDWNGYVESNGDFVWDVNGDGRPDVIAGSFLPSQVYWYENPGQPGLGYGQQWKRHLLADTGFSQNEGSFLHDIDGDGVPEWITNSWSKTNPLLIWSLTTSDSAASTGESSGLQYTMAKTTIGAANGHGMGFGDVNNDGREDILVGTGWYERPEGDPLEETWDFHPDWDLHASVPVVIRDFDGDGFGDIIWGEGHDYGLWVWWGKGADESGKLQFEPQLIDKTFSQPHALHLADLDGDGVDELITGKRVRAHNGNDPGGKESPILCYYTIQGPKRTFERHVINEGEVGIGLQIRTADLDGDGDLEIIVAGKEGTHILWNEREGERKQGAAVPGRGGRSP